MVYYEETKLTSNWQLNTVLALSSEEAPSVVKRRENGELKIGGARGGGGGAPLISPLPTPQPTGRTKESSAEERALLVQFNATTKYTTQFFFDLTCLYFKNFSG